MASDPSNIPSVSERTYPLLRREFQTFDALEVPIKRKQRQSMLQANGGDLNVVLGNGCSRAFQAEPHFSIDSRCFPVGGERVAPTDEIVDPCELPLWIPSAQSPETKFSDHGEREPHLAQ